MTRPTTAATVGVAGSARAAVRLAPWRRGPGLGRRGRSSRRCGGPSTSARVRHRRGRQRPRGRPRRAPPRSRGRVGVASTQTCVRARVSATWKTRRSPSSSSLSRWGKRPAEAPKTTTWSHSLLWGCGAPSRAARRHRRAVDARARRAAMPRTSLRRDAAPLPTRAPRDRRVRRAVGLAPRRVQDVHVSPRPTPGADGPQCSGRRARSRPPPGRGRPRSCSSLGTSRPDRRPARRRMSSTEVHGRSVTMSATIGEMPRDGRRIVSRMSSRGDVAPDPRRSACTRNVVRMPVRPSTDGPKVCCRERPTPCTPPAPADSAALTRASTAMSDGRAPAAVHPPMTSTARSASAAPLPRPHRDRSSPRQRAADRGHVVGAARCRPDGLLHPARLCDRRWRAAPTTAGGHR